MAKLLSATSKNGVQKTLAAELLSTASTGDAITFADVDGIPNLPGVLVIDRIDSAGTATPAKREYIEYSGTSGTTVLITTRNVDGSGSAQTHAVGAIVEFVPDVVWADRIYDALSNIVDVNNVSALASGITLSSPTLLSPNIPLSTGWFNSSGATITTIKDEDDMASNSATALSTQQSAKAYVDNGTWLKDSMARQAIINGNFDVWQRGTSLVLSGSTQFLSDHFSDLHFPDGGTNPTLTRSRQILTSGDIANAFYYTRLATNGAGTSLGVNSIGILSHKIEYGTRFLAGDGKKITVSFWARSDIANKKLGIGILQNYGTGGSPTAQEIISGQVVSITSTWTKYTATFTTNTLASKTFGTANDDYIELNIYYAWGSTRGTERGLTGAETYVGSGNIDIAQVQLCAGDVALPFMPKSFEEEEDACHRYCQAIVATQINGIIGNGVIINATKAYIQVPLYKRMRTTPTLIATAGDWKCNFISGGLQNVTDLSIMTDWLSERFITLIVVVASGLTTGYVGVLVGDGTANRKLILEAEL